MLLRRVALVFALWSLLPIPGGSLARAAEKAFGTDSTCGMASRVACHHAAELEMQLGGAAPRLEQLVQSDAAAAAALAAGEDHGRTALQRPTATAPSLPVGTAIAFAPSALGTADAVRLPPPMCAQPLESLGR
eukprot:SAG11_NODE_592_length_8310_cov_3.191868_9_plen_133_part_00